MVLFACCCFTNGEVSRYDKVPINNELSKDERCHLLALGRNVRRSMFIISTNWVGFVFYVKSKSEL